MKKKTNAPEFRLELHEKLNNPNLTAPLSEADLLQYAVKNGKIDIDVMLGEINDMNKKEILSRHKYAISHCKKGDREYYCTHLPNPKAGGARLFRKRDTLEQLEEAIVEYYRKLEEEIYIDKVWKEYNDRRLDFGEIQQSSYDRYNDDFHRFFIARPNNLIHRKFRLITPDDIEVFIKTAIKELGLSRKAYGGLRTIIRGTFKYGKRRRYTDLSISEFFGDLELPRNIFERRIIEKEKEVFNEDEIPVITSYLRENPDLRNLGILLTFETGLRVGELAALRASDLNGRVIRIRRSEVKYRISTESGSKWLFEVQEHAKTDAGARDLIIPSGAAETFHRITELNPDGEYLFEENGKRFNANSFNKRLTSVCRKAGIPKRSMHKIRKTYGTTLIDSGVDEKFIQEQMGHRDITTTKKFYYFSNKSQKNKELQIERAFSS